MSTAPRWAIRTDSSLHIGAGHLMRCLTLARRLRKRGADVEFLCADLPGHLGFLVEQQGFALRLLPGYATFDAVADVASTRAAAGPVAWDWLVADHYGIDASWERVLRGQARRILVIDDLADRSHDCDALLDQNHYEGLERRYEGLVPAHCRLLLGPAYLMLREEFIEAKAGLRRDIREVRRILVNFGGTDEANVTGLALRALAELNPAGLEIDVVIGATNPHRAVLEKDIACLADARLHVQTSRMAELIAAADMAVGASGSGTWERCCLGLPSLALVLADNQRAGAAELARAGIIVNLGEAQDLTVSGFASAIDALMADRGLRAVLSARSLALGVGDGPDVAQLLMACEPV